VPRLDVLLARNLGCSRTAAATLIGAGRVRDTTGRVLDQRRAEIAASTTPVEVILDEGDGNDDGNDGGGDGDDQGAGASARRVLLYDAFHALLNKPLGVITALRDDRHPTAFALVRDAPLASELRAVGRLDLDTSGLLLWTTDGQWVQRLTHPKRMVPRTYQAALARPFRAPPVNFILEDGHRPTIQSLDLMAREGAHPALAVPPETTTLAQITVIGGAYHEVRRIFAALDSHVLGLCRVAFGRLALPHDLAPGSFIAADLTQVQEGDTSLLSSLRC
jgi:16S rRNA pseudouridine516 synthase